MTKEQLETYKNTYDRYDGISNNEFDSICDELIKHKDLEEQLGCPLETVIEHINESYKMLCNHIEINEEYIKLGKCRDLEELVRRSDDIAISKEQKGLCEKYFTWLRKDRN